MSIDVKDRVEGKAIQRALQEDDVRAFLVITGTLAPLTPRGRERVLQYVTDLLDERATNGNGTTAV